MYPAELQQTITLPDGSTAPLGQILEQAVGQHQNGQLAEAQRGYQLVLDAVPDQPHALHLMGVMRHQQGQNDEAEKLIRQSLDVAPGNPDALCNLGAVLNTLGRFADAAERFSAALEIEAGLPNALNGLGSASLQMGKVNEARALFEKAVAATPGFAEAHNNLSMCLLLMGDAPGAEQASRNALKAAPGHPGAMAQLAETLRAQGNHDEAISTYQQVVQAAPDVADFWYNLGVLQDGERRWADALTSYSNALQIDPTHGLAISATLFLKRALLDWDGIDVLSQQFFTALEKGVRGLTPFSFTLEDSTPAQQLSCAKLWFDTMFGGIRPMPQVERVRGEKITLGYVSTDFYRHPTAYLMAGLFEAHNRDKFKLVAYSNGPDDGSDIRARVVAAFDEFIDTRGWPPGRVAQKIRDDEVDILVDLKGYTEGAITAVFAFRPAPVQVSFLGYPGTMGAHCIDYLIADESVVPVEQEAHYSEKILRLPGSYQVNDDKRSRPDKALSRADYGLPEEGFVFCCFNGSQKINPAMLKRWKAILDDVPDSVLWLLEPNADSAAKDNLRESAAAMGLDPERIVFAGRASQDDYLARYLVADLFLDTLPYNAHTTASDALWMGCPVVTLPGETFASRVGMSLLNAIGMPELITTSAEAYQKLAVELATDSEKLNQSRQKIAENRQKCALFNTSGFTRAFEDALQTLL